MSPTEAVPLDRYALVQGVIVFRTITPSLIVIACAALASGCPGEETATSDDAGTESPRDDGGVGGGDTGDDAGQGTGDGGAGAMAPILASAQARQVGRFGDDLRIDVTGTDRDGDAIAVRLSFLAADDEPLALLDTDGDGELDPRAAEVPLHEALPNTEDASSFALLSGAWGRVPSLRRVRVALLDAAGATSAALDVEVQVQEVLDLNALCDATFVANRCKLGLGCKGPAPQACLEGEQPEITQAGYFVDELGSRILVEGTDPDQDVVGYSIDFLDAADEPVALDLDGDDLPESTSFRSEVEVGTQEGKFFFRFDPSEYFVEQVAKVRVRVHDIADLESAPLVLSRAAAPSRGNGASCDPRTFNRCAGNSVCTTLNGGRSYVCSALSASRQRACNGAPALAPGNGVTSVRGHIAEPSLWDTPGGCSSNDPTLRPDALVKLELDKPASKVVLSTDNAYTSFDSALYLLSACDAVPVVAWCSDDQLSGARAHLAVLELHDLAAGTYYVVVDSYPASEGGTTFQLDVTIED